MSSSPTQSTLLSLSPSSTQSIASENPLRQIDSSAPIVEERNEEDEPIWTPLARQDEEEDGAEEGETGGENKFLGLDFNDPVTLASTIIGGAIVIAIFCLLCRPHPKVDNGNFHYDPYANGGMGNYGGPVDGFVPPGGGMGGPPMMGEFDDYGGYSDSYDSYSEDRHRKKSSRSRKHSHGSRSRKRSHGSRSSGGSRSRKRSHSSRGKGRKRSRSHGSSKKKRHHHR